MDGHSAIGSPRRPIVIVGAGKLGNLLLDCLEGDERYEVVAFLDDELAGGDLAGIPILRPGESVKAENFGAILAIGYPQERLAMMRRCSGLSLEWLSFVDRRAIVSSRATIGAGVVVLSFAMIAATTKIGSFVYVSSYARIGAHAVVGDYTSVLSGAAIGGSTIGHACTIGTNSSCLDGALIGDGATVGPHALVRGSVPPGALAVGPPGRVVRRLTSEHVGIINQ